MHTKICKHCGAEFQARLTRRIYCGRECSHANTRGRESINRQHGQSNSPEYVSWRHMKQRCSNPKRRDYQWYGARGIKVCERWQLFANFIEDMGLRPTIKHSLDRIDNTGNYEPGNCKWSTRLEQGRNRRGVYTPEEDQKIREAVELGLNFREMAEYVGKPRSSVEARTYRIGLKSGTPPIQKITDRDAA